jgi:uncharacterized damage-inducible protein DinB
MDHRAHFALLARYDRWANQRLFDGLAPLDDAAWHADQGLFFGSIHRTFDHNLLVMRLWTGRLRGQAWRGKGLDEVQEPDRAGLLAALLAEGERLEAQMHALPDPLPARLGYQRIDGQPMDMPLAPLLAHLFNHATHHRGQITAAAHRLGLRVQELDLPYFLHDVGL